MGRHIGNRKLSFPHDWTKPGEIRYDSTGLRLTKGYWPWVCVRALLRRYVLRREPIFWMEKNTL